MVTKQIAERRGLPVLDLVVLQIIFQYVFVASMYKRSKKEKSWNDLLTIKGILSTKIILSSLDWWAKGWGEARILKCSLE